MERDKFKATCQYVTNGKPLEYEGDISIRKTAKQLVFFARKGFLEGKGLSMPKKITTTHADFQKQLAENQYEYSNMLIVDTPHFNWADETAA